MKVKFTFYKTNQKLISLIYKPFDNIHSNLWVEGINYFINSGQQLTDLNRVYNFKDYTTEFELTVNNCNKIIENINSVCNLKIPNIRANNLQEDVNLVHTYFVDSNRRMDHNILWNKLNEYLHGLETIQRGKSKDLQGQVFCNLPTNKKYDIPKESYSSFTTKKQFGYCYANYPHIGRHILEMYNARDEEATDEDIIPMHKIAGDFYLWFGNNTPWYYDIKRMLGIRKWFRDNNIQKKIGLAWGDPKLAIGWLPVAKLDHTITKQELIGLHSVSKIEII